MAFRPILSKRAALPAAIGTLATSTLLLPTRTLHAEAPPEDLTVLLPPISPSRPQSTNLSKMSRKPIYDDLPSSPPTTSPTSPTPSPRGPTPTSRLATQIGHARSFLAAHIGHAEDRFNNTMTRAFSLEQSLTSTLASLAPAVETHERILPGALYVLVAAMAGSIVTRNRNILLRATVPLGVGVGAGWVVLPHTTRNVADLVWRYEERVPVLAMNHLRARGAAEEAWRQARSRGERVGRWADERVREGREGVEGWVRKGR
ncbi:MAG: hypothetical protein MMC23_003709 [Stictis urceolatum]|nr:hypothetical protein [Stictis urceolata]